MTYAEFAKMQIDLGALGAEGGRNAVRYICTPKGANIFGWAGVDGIHFCTVKGCGETVFSVSPMNMGQDCVQPLARDTGDFLRLLLACGDTAALEQAWMWTEEQFKDFLRENPPTEEQRTVMREIEEKSGLTPMERPWQYLKEVRAETDCSMLRFDKEYEELLHPEKREPQEWAVYFECGFCGKKPRRRTAGSEVPLNKTFLWGGEEWLAPALYCCSEGLVLDLLKKVPEETLHRFAEKWGMDENGAPQRELTADEQDELEAENPMEEHFRTKVTVNGRELQVSTGYGRYWYPDDGCREGEADGVLTHYGLPRDCGWVIWRLCCPWDGKRLTPETLELTLTAEKTARAGAAFTAEAGKEVPLTDPRTGLPHILRVISLKQETMEQNSLLARGMVYPRKYTELRYTLEPPLPAGDFTVQDATPNDEVRFSSAEDGVSMEGSACIGIIGGADGPTAVFVTTKEKGKAADEVRTAYSSLRYEPAKTVTWRIRFMERPKDDITVTLLP